MTTQPPPIPLSELDCPEVSAEALIDRYEVLLLDAYGVLVDSAQAVDGAAEFLAKIVDAGRDFLVVTNDASKLPDSAAERFARDGLDIPAEKILTSGELLTPFFEATGMRGARCMVLGPPDSFEYVRLAGGEPIEPSAFESIDALVICDDAGYPFLATIDAILSNLCRHIDRGELPKLVLPNPDILYPKGGGGFGVTSGGAALLLEAALAQRYPQMRPTFARLGKPFGPMFREVKRRVGDKKMVMVGDQISTDIIGARAADIDAVLVESGIAQFRSSMVEPHRAPTYRMSSLDSAKGQS